MVFFQLLRVSSILRPSLHKPIQSSLLSHTRYLSDARLSLSNLTPPTGLSKKKRRCGRGPGSGKGKTSGRGGGGQKKQAGNHGLKGKGFEGGQFPLYRRLPKVGFKGKKDKEKPKRLTFHKLVDFYNQGRFGEMPKVSLSDGRMLSRFDMKTMFDCNIVGKIPSGVKLTAEGYQKYLDSGLKLDIEVTRASKKAVEVVESLGGRVTTKFYSPLALKVLTKPEKFEILPREPRPSFKKKRYYVEYDNRGYLSLEKQMEQVEENLWRKENAAATSANEADLPQS